MSEPDRIVAHVTFIKELFFCFIKVVVPAQVWTHSQVVGLTPVNRIKKVGAVVKR